MAEQNIFEVAVRNKLRFPFRGFVSVEDLFDLNLEQLDTVYKTLNSELKKEQEESLLNSKNKANQEAELKIEIVQYIFNQKRTERETKINEQKNAAMRQRLLQIQSERQDQVFLNMSDKELQAAIDSLN